MASKKNVLLSAALGGLFLASCTTPEPSSGNSMAMGECHGVNGCKGQGDCGGKGHECAGKNTCKGKGWKKMSMTECKEKGGTFKETKM